MYQSNSDYDTKTPDWNYTLPWKRETVLSKEAVQTAYLEKASLLLRAWITVVVKVIRMRISELGR